MGLLDTFNEKYTGENLGYNVGRKCYRVKMERSKVKKSVTGSSYAALKNPCPTWPVLILHVGIHKLIMFRAL